MTKRACYVLTDAQGESVIRVITTDSGVGAIETAIQNHSNGAIVSCAEGLLEIISETPVVAEYSTVRISARLNFASVTGSLGSVFIDSPNSDIFASFSPDEIDLSAVADLIAACVGNLICGDGTVAASVVGGTLVRTKLNAIATLTGV